jgi:Undecaprenyl-phosphate galactose phosphotransferase WbaP
MTSKTTVLPTIPSGSQLHVNSWHEQFHTLTCGLSLNFELDSCAAEPLKFRERHTVPWLMGLTDVCVALVTVVLGFFVRNIAAPWLTNSISLQSYRSLILALAALPLANWLMRLYPGYGLGPVERLRRRVIGAGITFGGLAAWDSFVLRGEWSRGIELSSFVLALILSPLAETAVIAVLVRYRWWGTPVVVLSSDNAGSRIVETLRRKRELGLVPIGLLKDLPATWDTTIAGVPVLGPISLAPSLHSPKLAALVQTLPFPSVIFVPELPDIQSLWTTPRDLGGALGLELRRNQLLKSNYYFKRVFDYAISVPLFLASVPLVAALALWIKHVSPGPAFYAQEREGYRGGKIRIWKLRTMYPDAEHVLERYLDLNPIERAHWKQFFKLKHDPRILPGVGHLLRRTSLDELPQFWNVIRGEMSLVGPRPFPVYHMDSFGDEFRELRQSVPPGLTGYWQVSERSDADLKAQEHLDTYYIRNWSLWMDLYILVCTLKVVVMPRGAY